MEAVVDAAVAAGVFAIAVGLMAFFGLGGSISYLNYTEDALVRNEARAVVNMLKGLISRSSYDLHRVNPAYSGATSVAVEGFKVNFIAKVRFTQSVAVEGLRVALSYPSEYRICPTLGGSIVVTLYSVGVKGLKLDPSLVRLDREGKVSVSTNAVVCSFEGVSQLSPESPSSVFSIGMPAVVYTDEGSYYVIPPAFPEAVVAVVGGRYVEPASVRVPSDAVYISETTVMEKGVNLVIEVWAWTGGLT